jgi:hypothetical protein
LVGNTDIEDSLQRLDRLTQEEARMASAVSLRVTHNVDARLRDVEGKVEGVDNRVQGIGSDVNDISCDVREVNRSLSRSPLLVVLRAQTMTQGISSEIVFYNGFRRQIHPSTITLHPKLITTVQPNGSFEAKYLIDGNPLAHSCGYMESVCHF